MLLALDIGNTQTSIGVLDQGLFTHHWRVESKVSRTEDEYASLLFPLLDHVGLKGAQWDAVVLCSVVPPIARTFATFCRQYLKVEPFRIHSGLNLGLTVNVEVPAEVGADRLANAAYAVSRLRLPAIVIDLGTATTFDVVTASREYLGGVILPGVRMGVEALGSKTSQLPLIDLEFPRSVIGRSTVDCIRSGILYGYCDLMNGLLERMEAELGTLGDVALTGGLSGIFRNRLRRAFHSLPDLTLEGAAIIFEANRARA